MNVVVLPRFVSGLSFAMTCRGTITLSREAVLQRDNALPAVFLSGFFGQMTWTGFPFAFAEIYLVVTVSIPASDLPLCDSGSLHLNVL